MQAAAASSPIGIVYNTSVARPDAALALAALYSLATRNQLRVGSVCVSGAGLGAAIFCDMVGRMYYPGARGSNTVLPIGLATTNPPAPDPAMIKPALERMRPVGGPQYVHSIQKLTDTGLAEAVLRNGTTIAPQAAVVLSAPATWLARALSLGESKSLFEHRVKRLVIVEAGAAGTAASALRKIVAEWPSPIVFCGRDIGEALPFPGATLDNAFGWTPAHPAADAYRAAGHMPYDAPMHDVAGLSYAAHPEAGWFDASETGSLAVGDDGSLKFTPGAGSVKRLRVDAAKRNDAAAALVTMATSAPAPPPGRRGG
jgi:hypothetical protein